MIYSKNMMKRRDFMKVAGLGAVLGAVGGAGVKAVAGAAKSSPKPASGPRWALAARSADGWAADHDAAARISAANSTEMCVVAGLRVGQLSMGVLGARGEKRKRRMRDGSRTRRSV